MKKLNKIHISYLIQNLFEKKIRKVLKTNYINIILKVA